MSLRRFAHHREQGDVVGRLVTFEQRTVIQALTTSEECLLLLLAIWFTGAASRPNGVARWRVAPATAIVDASPRLERSMLLRTARLVGLLAAVLIVNAPAPAAAQVTDTTTERPLLVSKLGLRSGAVVRISQGGGPDVQGRLVRATDHSVILMDHGSEHTVPLTLADRVWTASGSTKRGALWGGIIGLLPGAALFALSKGLCEAVDNKCEGQGEIVALGVGAVGAGALVGALVGSRWEWRRRYP